MRRCDGKIILVKVLLHACISVHMHVMHVYMYVFMCVCMHVMYVCMYLRACLGVGV